MTIRSMPACALLVLWLVLAACGTDAQPSRPFVYETGGDGGESMRVTNADGFACTRLRVEAACGKCQFGLPGDDCALAIRTGGNAWYVDGADLDGYGDAHAADGMCNAVRYAVVSGRLSEGRFVVTSFELVESRGVGG